MKKILALVLALALVLSCSAAMAKTLTYAEVNPADTIVGQTATAFKEKVEELSGGALEIDIQFSGVLGSEAQILDDISMGGDGVDIMRISAFALSSYGCPKATLLSLPYTFVDRNHFWNFATSDLAKEFLLEPVDADIPVRGLFYFEEGFRHFFFKTEVNSVNDLAGMKIRVSDDPVMNGMVKGLGAIPTVVSFTELYSALQTGVVDAAEQPTANYKANAFPEVAPVLWLDGHTLGAVQVIVTDNCWDSLTEEEQGWITEASAYAGAFARELSESKEQAVLDQLVADGYTVTEVSAEEKAVLAEKCADIVGQFTVGNEDLYAQIVAMQ